MFLRIMSLLAIDLYFASPPQERINDEQHPALYSAQYSPPVWLC
jgi:hypothetical protein